MYFSINLNNYSIFVVYRLAAVSPNPMKHVVGFGWKSYKPESMVPSLSPNVLKQRLLIDQGIHSGVLLHQELKTNIGQHGKVLKLLFTHSKQICS